MFEIIRTLGKHYLYDANPFYMYVLGWPYLDHFSFSQLATTWWIKIQPVPYELSEPILIHLWQALEIIEKNILLVLDALTHIISFHPNPYLRNEINDHSIRVMLVILYVNKTTYDV